MPTSRFPIRVRTTRRSSQLKEAIVAGFALDPASALLRLEGFEEADWLSVLWWLDASGLAIYFYDRAREIGADPMLPPALEADLALRLESNRIRMKFLFEESRALANWFRIGNIPYALLKGVTLTPHSVPDSVLRCQADLDFLIADGCADLAVHYVQRLGYHLHAHSGSTLEFRAGPSTTPDALNIYSVKTQRMLEIHLATETCCDMQLLSRRVQYDFAGARIHALSPPDILIEQARHLLKHLCGEHTRVSWVLEFWRHIKSRTGDNDFWCRAVSCAPRLTHGDLALAMASWLAEDLFGGIQAEIPPQWRVDALPVRVRLWLERYARRLLLSDAIGSKLYALLRNELPGGARQKRTTFQILLPRVLPAAMLEAQPHESRSQRWARYRIEAHFVLRRLWFHLREGIRFAVEVSRWNRTVARVGR